MVIGILPWSPEPYCTHHMYACCSDLDICCPAGCAVWTASQVGAGLENQLLHEGTPLEAYRQRAREISSASAGQHQQATIGLTLSVLLAVFFTGFQACEYVEA